MADHPYKVPSRLSSSKSVATLDYIARCTADSTDRQAQCEHFRMDYENVCTYRQMDGVCISSDVYEELTGELQPVKESDFIPITEKLRLR